MIELKHIKEVLDKDIIIGRNINKSKNLNIQFSYNPYVSQYVVIKDGVIIRQLDDEKISSSGKELQELIDLYNSLDK